MATGHRTAELRSIALHRLVGERLDDALIAAARERAETWLAEAGPVHPEYARRWLELLNGPRDGLLAALTEDSEEMRTLRQSSPFAGVLTEAERLEVIRAVP